MKRSVAVFTILFGLASVSLAVEPSALTTLRDIHALSNAEASRALPVSFEATVTYFRADQQVLFVEDKGDSIYVQVLTTAKLLPGDRILIKGKTHNSYRPEIFADSVVVLRHGELPKPTLATFDQLIRGQLDCAYVKVRAVVRTADIAFTTASPVRSISMEAVTDGGILHINLDSDDAELLKDLLDSEIEVVGVASGRFDGKNQLTGIDINVPNLAGIRILKRASVGPWSLPVTSMGEILNTYHEDSRTQRIHVRGVITYYQPGSTVVLENAEKTLRISTRTYTPLRVGDLADVTGFPDLSNGFLTLNSAEVLDTQERAPIQPVPSTWDQLSTSQYIFDLVSVEGVLVTKVREATQDEYVLDAGGHLVSAIYHHPDAQSQLPLPPMKDVPIGARIRISGICIPYTADAFSGPVPFDILLRNFDDVTLIANPSWLSDRMHLMVLIGLLIAAVFMAGVHGWSIERKIRRQTVATAYIERRRSRILEEISNSKPLAGILEEITELVSFKLKGAPSWCQIADGAQLGNCPPKLHAFRVIEHDIPARSGPALGILYAALDPLTKPTPAETEALTMAAALSALAIETSRLNSDLRRRSEFDLLTDTHNRFSLDKTLDNLIADARKSASIFGFVYIDLDEFKQINDRYGHHVGDRFLQEAAVRMKKQLRSHDMLARQGGDEFAALIPVVRSRAEVEEIAQRLENCFAEPFAVEGHVVLGSASIGIAIYPEDGDTRDALMNTADAAMYRVKHSAGHARRGLAAGMKPTLVQKERK